MLRTTPDSQERGDALLLDAKPNLRDDRAHVSMDIGERAPSVARWILDLAANLAKRPPLPAHTCRRQQPGSAPGTEPTRLMVRLDVGVELITCLAEGAPSAQL